LCSPIIKTQFIASLGSLCLSVIVLASTCIETQFIASYAVSE